jgi:hypothetical protein
VRCARFSEPGAAFTLAVYRLLARLLAATEVSFALMLAATSAPNLLLVIAIPMALLLLVAVVSFLIWYAWGKAASR